MKWLILLFFIFGCSQEILVEEQVDSVCYEEHCFEVELAKSDYEQALGLSYRRHMDLDKGMLFIFNEPAIHQFWMKNTYISLDIIWIDASEQVVYIEKDAQPCPPTSCPTIDPGKIAKYVLEVNGGVSEQIGLAVGDFVSIELIS